MTELYSTAELPTGLWFTPGWSLESLVGVVSTTRHGAFSTGVYSGFNLAPHVGDDIGRVNANRERLRGHYRSMGLRQIQWLNQVHGVDVVSANFASARTVPDADAAWTDQPGLGLAVMTADCLPVVVAASDGSCIGIAHGGWRGLVKGVLANLLAVMKPPATAYQAWIGPGIGVSAYEVGEEVAAEVRASCDYAVLHPGRVSGKYQLDLAALAQAQLENLGIDTVVQSGICSVSNPGCYSYRRDGRTGRMATLVWLRSGVAAGGRASG